MKNYYEILEVSENASIDQIKKAYRIKVVKYHPDKHFGDQYFVDKFIEVNDAYNTLANSNSRVEYDTKFKNYYAIRNSKESIKAKEESRKEKERESQFFYDPYKPFYSFQDRIVNETPQFNPVIDHWGDKVPLDMDFFSLPKNIGKIVSGYSTLLNQTYPLTNKEKVIRFAKSIFISTAITLIILLAAGAKNVGGILSILCLVVVITIWRVDKKINFSHSCSFAGVNGFAEYKCEYKREIITSSYEINFNAITDFIRIEVVNKHNFSYAGTTYIFGWIKDANIISETSGEHKSSDGKPPKADSTFWINVIAEKYWTIYLLDKMEKNLEQRGYIEFYLFTNIKDDIKKIPFIQLGPGFIKFIYKNEIINYNQSDIKNMYTKGTNLFIEHQNYEKKYIFFEAGNKHGIPLLNLSNRLFFFKAMEIFLGYKI